MGKPVKKPVEKIKVDQMELVVMDTNNGRVYVNVQEDLVEVEVKNDAGTSSHFKVPREVWNSFAGLSLVMARGL